MNKEDIEKTLEINGVGIEDGDEKVRQVLLSARYKEEEIKEALQLLRQTEKINQSKVEGLHKLFRTDGSLGPEEISRLLNIEIKKDTLEGSRIRAKDKKFTSSEMVMVFACSIVLAFGGVVLYMYMNEMGIFHPSSILSLKP